MKSLKLLFLLVMIPLFCSCPFIHDDDPSCFVFTIKFSFQNNSGKDLVKGIELLKWSPEDVPMEEAKSGLVNRSAIRWDVVFLEPCKNWNNINFSSLDMLYFELRVENDYNYLHSEFILDPGDCPNTKTIYYKMNSYYIFGDYNIHNIITHWETPKSKNHAIHNYVKCNSIEFEGKVYTPSGSKNTVTIIIEGKDNQ